MSDTVQLFPGLPTCDELKYVNETDPRIANIINDYSRQIDEKSRIKEEEKLAEIADCSVINRSSTDSFSLKLNQLANDDERIVKLLSGYDTISQELHQNISCLVSSILLKGTGTLSKTNKILNWFSGIRQIGSESIEGYALTASFVPDGGMFIIKTSRDSRYDEISHEAVCGFYVTNKLRKYIPNFMYVYGYTKCSPAIIINKEVENWCSSTSGDNVSYMFLENIRDSQEIGEWVVDASYDNFVKVVLQIFNALNVAYHYYGFVHHDLHKFNIMVRKFTPDKDGKTIPINVYSFDNPETPPEYLATEFVPYFIDYGFAEFKLNGVSFKKPVNIKDDDYRFPGFPMVDVYKVLGTLARILYENHASKKRIVEYEAKIKILDDLFEFFGEGDIITSVKDSLKRDGNYYIISPRTHETKTYQQFMSFNNNYDRYFKKYVFEDLSGLNSREIKINEKISTCDFFDSVYETNILRNAIEYLNMIDSIDSNPILTDDQRLQAKKYTNVNYNSFYVFEVEQQRVSIMLETYTNIIKQVRALNLNQRSSLQDIKDAVKYAGQIRNIFYFVKTIISTNFRALKLQSLVDQKTIRIINQYTDRLNNDILVEFENLTAKLRLLIPILEKQGKSLRDRAYINLAILIRSTL